MKNSVNKIPELNQSINWLPLPSYLLPLFLSLFVVVFLLRDSQQKAIRNQIIEAIAIPTKTPMPTAIPTLVPQVFSGVGIRIRNFQASKIIVDKIIPGTPAEAAEIKPDDIITKIDGQVAGKDLDQAVQRIRGPEGSTVTLTLERDAKIITKKIIRQTVTDNLPY